ncbi:MAG: hypothetical protein IPI39_18310 [Candidatus Obscuribacter sp.]|nr:hypothetical protein [Candidatus Obscuribacter sp.]
MTIAKKITITALVVATALSPALAFGEVKPAQTSQIIFQNIIVDKLKSSDYDTKSVKNLFDLLKSKGTFTLKRYSTGGQSAVTVVDERSMESAISGLLLMQWDRDNIMQALAERATGLGGDWQKGLDSSLKHHYIYRQRFIDVIDGKVKASDMMARPHIRYNSVSLAELTEPWGHAQNDALSFIGYLLFLDLNQKDKSLKSLASSKAAISYALLLPHYLKAVNVANDMELGAWEDKRAVHASSIAVALAALREEYEYVSRHGAIKGTIDGDSRTFVVDEKLLRDLMGQCKAALKQILPYEYIVSDQNDTRADKRKVRVADSAIVNALIMGSLAERPLFDDAITVKLIDIIEANLMGDYGIARYPGDIWDGRNDRKDLKAHEEAQWCHVSPMISVVLGEIYRRTGSEAIYKRQVEHFNRGLSHVNSRFNVPEAYIIDPTEPVDSKNRHWISDANEPLAWAQAALLLSFDGMQKSIDYKHRSQKNTRVY